MLKYQCVVKTFQIVPNSAFDACAWMYETRIAVYFSADFNGKWSAVAVEILGFAVKIKKAVGVFNVKCRHGTVHNFSFPVLFAPSYDFNAIACKIKFKC